MIDFFGSKDFSRGVCASTWLWAWNREFAATYLPRVYVMPWKCTTLLIGTRSLLGVSFRSELCWFVELQTCNMRRRRPPANLLRPVTNTRRFGKLCCVLLPAVHLNLKAIAVKHCSFGSARNRPTGEDDVQANFLACQRSRPSMDGVCHLPAQWPDSGAS